MQDRDPFCAHIFPIVHHFSKHISYVVHTCGKYNKRNQHFLAQICETCPKILKNPWRAHFAQKEITEWDSFKYF